MAGQLVQQAVEQSVLRVAKQLEDQIDSELHKLDNLQDDDLERIRQRRIQDLRQQQEKTKDWIQKGHGEYKEIFEEKEFFKEMKGEDRMVCHFYRENWPCKVCRQQAACHASNAFQEASAMQENNINAHKCISNRASAMSFFIQKVELMQWIFPLYQKCTVS